MNWPSSWAVKPVSCCWSQPRAASGLVAAQPSKAALMPSRTLRGLPRVMAVKRAVSGSRVPQRRKRSASSRSRSGPTGRVRASLSWERRKSWKSRCSRACGSAVATVMPSGRAAGSILTGGRSALEATEGVFAAVVASPEAAASGRSSGRCAVAGPPWVGLAWSDWKKGRVNCATRNPAKKVPRARAVRRRDAAFMVWWIASGGFLERMLLRG